MIVPLDITDADWLTLAATACTNAEQVAIIPGALQREWREGKRRCCAYRSDADILNVFAVQSARYEVSRQRRNMEHVRYAV